MVANILPILSVHRFHFLNAIPKNLTSQKPCRTDLGRQPRKRNQDKVMTLAAWNVRSLYRPGAVARLKDDLNRYGIAITAFQEIRWSRSEIFGSGDFIVCYSGNKERRQLEQDS